MARGTEAQVAEIAGVMPGLRRFEPGLGPRPRRAVQGCYSGKPVKRPPNPNRQAAASPLTYTIPVGLPFPVKNYHSTMRVEPAGLNRCSLEWTCRAEPDGASDEQVDQTITGMYTAMIGWIRDHVGAS